MLKTLLKGLPPVVLAGAVLLIISLIKSKDNWSTSKKSPADKIDKRTANRGMFVSIISAVILSVVGGIMAGIKVPQTMIITNYGFILGPVIGYMLDIGIGTDVGFDLFKKDKLLWLKYILASLTNSKFLRYSVTVLLDLFISDPIQDVLRTQLGPIRESMMNEGKYSKMVADNLPSIIQSIVGFITFNAYTNQTRFNWAYPSENLPNEDKMSTFLVGLSTAIAGCLYLVHNKNASDKGIKLVYVLAAITMLYVMNTLGLDKDKKKTTEEQEIAKAKKRFLFGLIIFVGFVLYGLVYPFLNAGKGN